jgi:hypothetical protein
VYDVTRNLKLNIDGLLIQCLFDINRKHLLPCIGESTASLKRMTELYETALSKKLNERIPNVSSSDAPTLTQSMHHVGQSFGRGIDRLKLKFDKDKSGSGSRDLSSMSNLSIHTGEDDDSQVQSLKQQFELQRFDHLYYMNYALLESRLDVCEMLAGTSNAIDTFFRDGYSQAQVIRQTNDVMNKQIAIRRPLYRNVMNQLRVKRIELEQLYHRSSLTDSTLASPSLMPNKTPTYASVPKTHSPTRSQSGYAPASNSNTTTNTNNSSSTLVPASQQINKTITSSPTQLSAHSSSASTSASASSSGSSSFRQATRRVEKEGEYTSRLMGLEDGESIQI